MIQYGVQELKVIYTLKSNLWRLEFIGCGQENTTSK